MPEQIAGLQALIRQLASTGQLPQSNADDLVHNLDDLEHLIAAGKQPESRGKLATIRKKNDDLLTAGKISPTGHAQIDARLDSLAVVIAAMSPSPTATKP